MGIDCLDEAMSAIRKHGFRKALIVTDAGLAKAGVAARIAGLLAMQDIDSVVFDGAKPNPSIDNVEKGLVAINTTAGTASEMTRFCIITDESRHVKMAIVDRNVTPLLSVNDPALMVAMPKGLTAATGMDALTHAIEAYVSTAATPITDACAIKAIELISANLRQAVFDGGDLQARESMAYAQFLAGMAFNNASLGFVHAMP